MHQWSERFFKSALFAASRAVIMKLKAVPALTEVGAERIVGVLWQELQEGLCVLRGGRIGHTLLWLGDYRAKRTHPAISNALCLSYDEIFSRGELVWRREVV